MSIIDTAPLSDVRILDLTVDALGTVGRILAELGADVVKVESPASKVERLGRTIAAGRDLAFVAANLGKRSLALDLDCDDDRAMLGALAGAADLVLASDLPGGPDIRVLGVRHPELLVLSMPAFGAGPLQKHAATDAVLLALNGVLSRSGRDGYAPLLPPGDIAVQCAVVQAAYAALVGLLRRRQTGLGDLLEVSLLDGSAQALDPGYGIAGSASAGAMAAQMPRGRPGARSHYPIYPSQDGPVRLCVLSRRQWRGMFDWLGRPAAFADPQFEALQARYESAELNAAIAALVAARSRAEIEADGRRFGVPVAAVLTLEEALASPHLRDGGLLRQIEVAPGLVATFPDGVLKIDGARARTTGAIPAGDLDADELLSEWSPREPVRIVGFGTPGLPLAGLKVIDLGTIVVGAEQGRLLADFGADVIKVECAEFPDGMRANSDGGMSPSIAAGHRNKRSLGLNLRSERGRDLLLDLIDQSDVVLSNFKPGGMASLGLAAETLLARNPRLIVVESSAFGDEGPWSDRMGYGPLVRASAGLTDRWRYDDAQRDFGDTVTVYPDHVAARLATVAVLALLLRRERTGRGGRIALGQIDVILGQMAPAIAASSLRAQGACTDAGAGHDAPWGVFPGTGDDDWIVITCRGDRDWRELCAAMDRTDLASDAALAHREGRVAARADIDAAVARWTSTRSVHAAAAALQRHGIAAAAMARAADMPAMPHFRERAMFQTFVQPQLGTPVTVDNAPLRSGHLATPPLAAAPMAGEHSVEIARERLRLDAEAIAALVAANVLQPGNGVLKSGSPRPEEKIS